MMSDHIFVLSDQNGEFVGRMSFQEKNICFKGVNRAEVRVDRKGFVVQEGKMWKWKLITKRKGIVWQVDYRFKTFQNVLA